MHLSLQKSQIFEKIYGNSFNNEESLYERTTSELDIEQIKEESLKSILNAQES
jgi:hypothetical protein